MSPEASFLWGKGVITAFHAVFDALGNGFGPEGEGTLRLRQYII